MCPDHHLSRICRHFDRFLEVGLDVYGPVCTPMWLASVDILRGGLPESPDPREPRVYRLIHAPRGSTLYWDLPLLVCAHHLAGLDGRSAYRAAADAYVAAFLERCVSPANGLFLWGNHIYYDVTTDENVQFSGGPHEIRPLPPAWDLLREADPARTERAVAAIGTQHVHNPATGEFCRHGTVESPHPPPVRREGIHPFLEAGGVIVESLGWLSRASGDRAPAELARRVAEYSFAQRDPGTGLLRNQPVKRRWDYHAVTTEVGFWSGCLVRAYRHTGETVFLDLAARAARAYLEFGWDEAAGQFLGMLDVASGTPVAERSTPYQPGPHADVWEPLFPTHDYPMPFAEACLDLWELTGDEVFATGARRWIEHLRRSLPARQGRGAYAEHYGRCLHFLLRAAKTELGQDAASLADRIAREALDHLWCEEAGMFRSHPGEDRADAVDGLGILFLALLEHETGISPDLKGFAF